MKHNMAPSEVSVGQAACAPSTTPENPSSTVPKRQKRLELVAYDSGAERPAFNDLKWSTELHLLEKPAIIVGTAGTMVTTVGGVVAYRTKLSTGEEVTVELKEAIYSPDLPANLISAALLLNEGIYWDQKRHILYEEDTGRVVTELRRARNLFVVTNAVPAAAAAAPVPVGAATSHIPGITNIATKDG